jgi:RNA polymerase sigma-70 factor (ECF subfamily)
MYEPATDVVSTVYEAHVAELQRFATAKVRDPAAAEDIVHDAFLRLAIESRAGRFPENPRAWLYRVAFNLIVSQSRRAATAARHGAQELDRMVDESPESTYLTLESAIHLHAAMATVSQPGRRGLMMAAVGYSGREIATALGRNEPAARALLHRARKVIRHHLISADPLAVDGQPGDGLHVQAA